MVLGYEAKRFHTFVPNRAQVLKTCTNLKRWRYIGTMNNPADHVSRGRTAEELVKSNWFSGPSFRWEALSSFKKRLLVFNATSKDYSLNGRTKSGTCL